MRIPKIHSVLVKAAALIIEVPAILAFVAIAVPDFRPSGPGPGGTTRGIVGTVDADFLSRRGFLAGLVLARRFALARQNNPDFQPHVVKVDSLGDIVER